MGLRPPDPYSPGQPHRRVRQRAKYTLSTLTDEECRMALVYMVDEANDPGPVEYAIASVAAARESEHG